MKNLGGVIRDVFILHQNHARTERKATRRWDGKTPYAIHPVWCAMTLLAETSLPNELRENGAIALLFHDILEDTHADLPPGTSARVRDLVEEMTFESFTAEMELVWGRSQECLLLKLYDKVSNLLDGIWMSPEKHATYVSYTKRIASEVERTFGPNLNILRIARAICA